MDEGLDRIFEDARRILSVPGPVVLDARYLHAVERLEELPDAAPGADKTWVLETARRAMLLLSHVELVT